jgi:hypothetical protein
VTLTKKWKKILAVGCSHGEYADPGALRAVLEFKQKFRPDRTVHLGDYVDVTALRSGARGTKDESAPLPPDIEAGLDFLVKLEPTDVLNGNHEDRCWRLQTHPNAIVSYCAERIVESITKVLQKLRVKIVPYTAIEQGVMIGGFRFMHGVFYNENHVRDHAEAFGNVVFAHAHRCGVAKGRRGDSPTGYCVGTLTERSVMDYAKARRATLAWSQGFVWGYYCDTRSVLWLHEQPHGMKDWILP